MNARDGCDPRPAEPSRGPRAIRAADLDGALAHWPIAPLPADFVAHTMARVRAEPRFRLAAGDAVVAAVAAVLLAIGSTAAGWLIEAPEHPLWRACILTLGRIWLAVRPVDLRLAWTLIAVIALGGVAVAAAAWIGRPATGWMAARR